MPDQAVTPTVSVVVMAHPKRQEFVPELLASLDRDAEVVWDQRNDRWDTGRRAWQAIDRSASHGLVVQDDAIICRDLVAGVEKALAHAPAKTPLCLYCGRVRPYRTLVEQLVERADHGRASWLTMTGLHWGVGIVLPVEFIDPMIAWADQRPDIANYDRRISRWLDHQNIRTWYPWPSLVDHRDSPSLVPGRGSAGRRAHRFAGADVSALDLRWDGSVVTIPALNIPEGPAPGMKGKPPVKFVSLKYPNLSVPSINVRFRPVTTVDGVEVGVADVTARGAIAHLQSPWMRRRGVALADEVDLEFADSPGAGQKSSPEPTAGVTSPPDGPPPAGPAGDVLAWVGDDPDRARRALEAEQARARPRTSLVAKLGKLAGPTTHDLTPASVTHHTTAAEV